MRDNYKVEDIQRVIWALFKSGLDSTSPWSSWDYILNYPDQTVFEEFTKPFIYFESPVIISHIHQQGGKLIHDWEMIIGIWDDRKTGGPGEINIITGYMLGLLSDPKTMNTKTFSVILGGTTYNNQTLVLQNIKITGFTGPREILKNTDEKEFRNEIVIQLRA